MDTKIEVTPEGQDFAAAQADELREQLKAAIDTLSPDQLLIVWASLEDQNTGKGA